MTVKIKNNKLKGGGEFLVLEKNKNSVNSGDSHKNVDNAPYHACRTENGADHVEAKCSNKPPIDSTNQDKDHSDDI
jgi:hypothetical protein